MGLDVAVNLERPGYSIKKRKSQVKKIGKQHLISKEDAIQFIKQKFNLKIEEK